MCYQELNNANKLAQRKCVGIQGLIHMVRVWQQVDGLFSLMLNNKGDKQDE